MPSRPRILIAEDDPALRELLVLVASRSACDVEAVGNGRAAIQRLSSNQYDVLLLDLMLPGLSGYEVIEWLRSMNDRPAVLVVTAMATHRYLDLDPEIVTTIIRKPFEMELLVALVQETATRMAARRNDGGAKVIAFPAS